MTMDRKPVVTDDPLALHAPRLFRAFGWYLRWFFWRNFHAVRIARCGLPDIPADRPLIIYTNHPSWWDPALFMLVSNTFLQDRAGFGPMEAEALARYKLFRRLGVYGIDSATRRGAARFMDVSLRILSDPAAARPCPSGPPGAECGDRAAGYRVCFLERAKAGGADPVRACCRRWRRTPAQRRPVE
jgi:hypothetical protein